MRMWAPSFLFLLPCLQLTGNDFSMWLMLIFFESRAPTNSSIGCFWLLCFNHSNRKKSNMDDVIWEKKSCFLLKQQISAESVLCNSLTQDRLFSNYLGINKKIKKSIFCTKTIVNQSSFTQCKLYLMQTDLYVFKELRKNT